MDISLGHLIDRAARAGAAIYSIDPSSLSPLTPGADFSPTGPGSGPDTGLATLLAQPYTIQAFTRLELYRTGLRMLAQGTGELMVADPGDIAHGVSKFFDDLSGHHLIAYKPESPERYFGTRKGAPLLFHQVKIRVKCHGLGVALHLNRVIPLADCFGEFVQYERAGCRRSLREAAGR